MSAGKDHDGAYKYVTLCVLTVQNALLILSMRYSRIQTGDMYISTTAVVLSELLKLVVCIIVLFLLEKKGVVEFAANLFQSVILNWKDTLKLSVPALVYMVQNNLQYIAVSNLDPAVFQVTYQLKILTTAIFSVVMLQKSLSRVQWGSLLMLFIGVTLVQLKVASSNETDKENENQVVGLAAVIISCLSSGFAGVYVEKMIKGSSASLWLRNIQLSLFGFLTAVLGMIVNDGAAVSSIGFFYGYNFLVFFVVCQQAIGGIIVSLVMKYADNILKGFSTSLSIIISCVVSVFLFSYVITMNFIIGCTLVIIAIYLYGRHQPQKPPAAAAVLPQSVTNNKSSNT